MGYVTFIVGYVQVDLAMGICPDKFRHYALDGDTTLFVVCRIAVMREQRAASDQKNRYQ